MRTERIRDCLLIYLHEKEAIVVTCDSIGAIGNKPQDIIQVTPEHTGHETAKVAFSEMIALGATPLVVSDGLSVETEPTGRRLMAGIQEAIAELPEYEIAMTGSCEDNMPTVQTGAGITVIGIIKPEEMYYRLTKATDLAVLMGRPLYGKDFSQHLDQALRLPDYRKIRKLTCIKEMVPVGSHGIGYEAEKIAADNHLVFKPFETLPFEMDHSGGPASCCVVTVAAEELEWLQDHFEKDVIPFGTFESQI